MAKAFSGKDIVAWNILIRAAIRKVGSYIYCLPVFSQCRRVLLNSKLNDGSSFMDFIPKDLISGFNQQEMKITLVNGSIIIMMGSNSYDCFDEKTEILTDDGWKFFKDLNRDEKVATLNDGYLEFDKPTDYIIKDFDGEMYSFLNSSMDFMVTPTHRFWVKSNKGIYKFKTIETLCLSGDKIPSTCLWKGIDKKVFKFPVITKTWVTGKGRICNTIWDRELPMEDFVALLGIFLSEGSTYKDYKTYRVIISQKKPHICNKIEALLDRCKLNYCYHSMNYEIQDKQLYEYFSQFGKQDKRFIPKAIKALSKKYLQILFDWLIDGDGTRNNVYTAYYSCSKRLIDDVQEILLKLGLSGNVSIKFPAGRECFFRRDNRSWKHKHNLYQITVRNSKFKSFSSSNKKYIDKKQYKGKVYCVAVPSGVIKVRRNGKEMWSGNSIVGSNALGIVISEAALADPVGISYLRPILTASNGFFIAISTPRGHNHFWELFNVAKRSDDWFVSYLTVEDTQHIPPESIESDIRDGIMSKELAQQEYFCSFSSQNTGAYYAKYIDKMRLNDQLTVVPYEPSIETYVFCDLGINDAFVLIWVQFAGPVIRIIDYYENNSEGIEHYVNIIKQKDYGFAKLYVPHDGKVRELQTGISRVEKLRSLGMDVGIVPKLPINDGIEAVRSMLPKTFIDIKKCEPLIKAIENYTKEYDEQRKVYRDRPNHNRWSNANDGLRYLAVMHRRIANKGTSPEELNARYNRVMYGTGRGNFNPLG